jgi:hypothetical protein
MEPHESDQLHRNALVIDSHNDTIVSHIRRGNRSVSGSGWWGWRSHRR